MTIQWLIQYYQINEKFTIVEKQNDAFLKRKMKKKT